MKSSVQKSIGDYGQEFTALSKFGATSIDIYNTQNKIGSTERTKTLPYNDTGNSLRVMIANDRPSAYRGIFISLFSNQSTINTRCIIGYYRSKIQDPSEESKNSLIMGQHVLSNDRKSIRTDEADTLVYKTQDDTTLVEEAKKTGKLRNVLKPSVRRSARQANSKPKWRTISMFFRRYPEFKTWSKERGIVIKPTNFRTRAREFSENFNENNSDAQREINFNPGGNLDWVMRGGKKNKPKKKKKRKTKKNKRRKNKTKKKSKNKKRKSIKKRNKKRRNTRKLK